MVGGEVTRYRYETQLNVIYLIQLPFATITYLLSSDDLPNSQQTGKQNKPASRAQILVNLTPWVAVRSCFQSRHFYCTVFWSNPRSRNQRTRP